MADLESIIVKYRFGGKFRKLLIAVTVLFIFFHVYVLLLPLAGAAEPLIERLRYISDSVSGISVGLILLTLVVEGQRNLRSTILAQRQEDYDDIAFQVRSWLGRSNPELFEPSVIGSTAKTSHKIFQNFQVSGSANKIAVRDELDSRNKELLKQYCINVHFELTIYPCEMIYGIHFEFDDYEFNRRLFQELKKELFFERQSSYLKEDVVISKNPRWIFYTHTVSLDGDVNDNFPGVLTHGRHFVELVCHSYGIVYGKSMIGFYLEQAESRVSPTV